MNPFIHKSAAVRYRKGRPFFHRSVMSLVRDRLNDNEGLARGLDVGCGTGLSAIALLEISSKVVGMDSSAEMVALAPRDARIAYTVGAAELLPFANAAFDLITISQVIHWLNPEAFLGDAYRVIRPGGWLIVYDNFFDCNQPRLGPEFQNWFGTYLSRYPKPHRREVALEDPNTWSNVGFRLIQSQRYENSLPLSATGLVDYLMTQSNVIAAVEGGRDEIDDVARWLTESTGGFFNSSGECEFLFSGPIFYLQRAA